MQDLFEQYSAPNKIFAEIKLNTLCIEDHPNLNGFYTPQELQDLYYAYGVTNATHFSNLFCVEKFKLAQTYAEVSKEAFESWWRSKFKT